MHIKITAGGIYDGEGKEVPIGTELEIPDREDDGSPHPWAGRFETIKGSKGGKTAVTNPAPTLKAEHHGGGKFNITRGEEVLLSGLSKTDADAFNDLSDDDKAAFVAEQAKS